jgi:hypothetical protein
MGLLLIDLTGQTCGRWTVVSEMRRWGVARHWHVVCECGNKHVVSQSALRGGYSLGCKSCSARDRTSRGILPNPPPNKKASRNECLCADRRKGMTFNELGKKYKISAVRARQLCVILGVHKPRTYTA